MALNGKNGNGFDEAKKKRARDIRIMRDKAQVFVVKMALPSMLGLVCLMVFTAIKMKGSESIGIVSALITVVVSGLLAVLRGITGTEKEDPMHDVAKELIDNMKAQERRNSEMCSSLLSLIEKKDKSQEITVGDNGVKIVEGDMKASVGKDLVWGKDEKPKK